MESENIKTNLNSKYTFENFIVSKNNEFAYKVASIAEFPVKYNPIYIYGGTELGKTHLLNAIRK